MRLADAIEEFVNYRKAVGYAKNTTRVDQQALDHLLVTAGNIQVKNLGTHHFDQFIASLVAKDFKPTSINLYRGVLRRFGEWAQTRRLMPTGQVLNSTTRRFVVSEPPRRRVGSADFPRLLDACTHPQQRVIVALGLYLFLRASEVAHLDVGHVRLDRGEIVVYQPKTKRYDEMPICAELDTELRRWLTWYTRDTAEKYGPIRDDWPLVPAKHKATFINDGSGKNGGRAAYPEFGQMNPKHRCGQVHLKVQDALRNFGWEVTANDREGVHTLRRSGARALFDHLVDTSEVRDGVMRQVMAMLHHKSVQVTERYLGMEADVAKRNDMLRGKPMFATPADNVIELKEKMG